MTPKRDYEHDTFIRLSESEDFAYFLALLQEHRTTAEKRLNQCLIGETDVAAHNQCVGYLSGLDFALNYLTRLMAEKEYSRG